MPQLDDLSLHPYRALQVCPGGQRPGEVFQATRAVGETLMRAQLAEPVDELGDNTSTVGNFPKKPKGYKRRDQVAEKPR